MQCLFIKENSGQCDANAMKSSEFCFTHNPETQELRQVAASRGGKSPKKNYDPLALVEINSIRDVTRLLATVINEVREGKIDLRVANCVGYLSGHLIKSLEAGDINEKLELINSIIVERKIRR